MKEIRDYYAQRARKEGYPARSVYKLMEIDEKFHVLPKGGTVLDVGAAPGSWSLFAARRVGGRGRVLGVDLKPVQLPNIPANLSFLTGDVFSTVGLAEAGPFDAVISDAAPATTGNRLVDAGRSYSLNEGIIDLAAELLKDGGNLVVKVFQGGDEGNLLTTIRERFAKAKAFKPKASRDESFEIFLVGLGKKAS